MKLASGHSRHIVRHDRRSKLKGNHQTSHTSVSSDGSAPVSLVGIKSGGNKSGRPSNSARRLFRAMFDKSSKKSASAAARVDCYPGSEVSSTTDQVGSISTFESGSRRGAPAKGPKGIVKDFTSGRGKPVLEQLFNRNRMQSSESQTPLSAVPKRSYLLDTQGEDAALADSINDLLGEIFTNFANVHDDAALADSINFLLGGGSTQFPAANKIVHDGTGLEDRINSLLGANSDDHPVSNEIMMNSSLHDLEFEPLNADDNHKSLRPEITLADCLKESEVQDDQSVKSDPSSLPPPPITQNDNEPATPCFPPKSPTRTSSVAPLHRITPTKDQVADSKTGGLHNMTQDVLREMVLQKPPHCPRWENHKQFSIPAFVYFRKAAGNDAGNPIVEQSRAIDQFQKAQDLLLRIKNNDNAEDLALLQKQVEALETEVFFSTTQFPVEPPNQCDSEVSSLEADEDSYCGENSFCDYDESQWRTLVI